MRQLITFALKRVQNAEVVEATDGVDGLKRLAADTFDLVITDINMPIMDGIKLVAMIRKDPAYVDVPILVVTTEGAEEDRDRAMALGANAYMTKPVQTGRLIEICEQFLKERKAAAERA